MDMVRVKAKDIGLRVKAKDIVRIKAKDIVKDLRLRI